MRKKTILYNLGWLLAISYWLSAIQIHAQNNFLQFEHLTGKNSLPQNSVYAICQDKQGFLWFGTADGLCRYDGTEMKIFRNNPDDTNSLPGNFIRKLRVDSVGNLWIGTENGLCWYNPSSESINRIHFATDKQYSSAGFSYCQLPTKDILFGTANNRFFRINTKTFKTDEEHFSNEVNEALRRTSLYTIFNYNSSLIFSENGCVAIYDYAAKNLKIWHVNDTLYRHINDVVSLGDSIYLAIYNGIIIMNRNTGGYRWVTDINTGVKTEKTGLINTLKISPSGELLLGTNESGLFVCDARLQHATHYLNNIADRNSVSFNSIRCLFYDRSGNLWIGTDGNGINKCSISNRFRHYNSEKNGKDFLSGDFVKCFFEDAQNNLYVGTFGEGLTTINPQRTSSQIFRHDPTNQQSLPSDNILCLLQDSRENIWIGTDKGLCIFNKEEKNFRRVFYENSNSGFIYSLTELSPAKIIIGTGDLSLYLNFDSGMAIKPIEDNSLLNVASFNKGADGNIYAASKLKYFEPGEITFKKLTNQLGNFSCFADANCCYPDKSGIVWVAGKTGLEKWTSDGKLLKTYTDKDGLPDSYLYAVLPDNKGNLWISSNNGISKFNMQSESFRNYDVTDGLQAGEFNSNAYFVSKQGEFFFGGINGFNEFYPDSIYDNMQVPLTAITSLRVFDKEWKSDSSVNSLHSLSLPYNENTLSFKLASLEFTQPEQNLISYRLLGFDTTWVSIGTERSLSFMGLPPGNYLLELKSCNNDGVWNDNPKKLFIHIIPPLWQTTWFRILSVIIILVVIILTVRYFATRKLKAQLEEIKLRHMLEKERSRISQDMHDEIGSGLSKISILSELAGNENMHPVERQQQMNKITSTSRQLVDNMQEIIWSLNPRNDTLAGLLSYMHEYANEYFDSTHINLIFEYPVLSNEETIYIKNTVRRNIFLAFKETLNNIVKHSGASEVKIVFTVKGDILEIMVSDNGKGIAETDFSKNGNGLVNMEKRMKESNGNVQFVSDKNSGTTIFFKIKLDKENALTT